MNTKAQYASRYTRQVTNMAQAEAAPPGVHSVSGATGLYLKKGETGAGSWVYRHWLGGERRVMGLGSLADVKLAAARVEAKRLAVLRDEGVDPLAEKREKKAANLAKSRKPASVTFRMAAEAYRDENAPHWKHRYAGPNWISPLVHWAFPVIGRLPLDEIEICMSKPTSPGTGRRWLEPSRTRPLVGAALSCAQDEQSRPAIQPAGRSPGRLNDAEPGPFEARQVDVREKQFQVVPIVLKPEQFGRCLLEDIFEHRAGRPIARERGSLFRRLRRSRRHGPSLPG